MLSNTRVLLRLTLGLRETPYQNRRGTVGVIWRSYTFYRHCVHGVVQKGITEKFSKTCRKWV